MRASQYNLEIRNNSKVLIVNLLSRSVLELNQDAYQSFCELRDSGFCKTKNAKINNFVDVLKNGRFICEDNFDEFIYLTNKVNQARKNERELALVITPTMGCNFSCHYCFENRVDGQVSEKFEHSLIKHVRQKLPGRDTLSVQWFGGEPLRALDRVEGISRQLIQLAAEYRIEYGAAMVTNGYLLDQNAASKISTLGIHTVQITLDGAKQIHDRVRKVDNGGSYEVIMKNIMDASKFVNIRLRIHVSPYNVNSISDLLNDISKQGIGKHISEVYFAGLFNYKPNTSGRQFLPDKKRFYKTKDYADVVVRLYAEAIRLGLPVADPLTADFSVCTAVRENAVVIGPSGNLYKCYFELDKPSKSVGHITTGVVSSSHLDQWHNHEIARDSECRECKFLPVCFGGCSQKWHDDAPKDVICTHLKFNATKVFPMFYSAK